VLLMVLLLWEGKSVSMVWKLNGRRQSARSEYEETAHWGL
jgi:hypothetical protein